MTARPGPGRPRATPTELAGTGREQILDAAAALFVEQGVAATSTRQIAERVGIRQASLYYHFAGKDELLAELLTTSVRPSLEFVRTVEARVPDEVSPAGALYALAQADVATLAATPHNIGTLYLLPEVDSERFDAFRAARLELQQTYGRLAAAAGTPAVRAALGADLLGALLIQLVEVVIPLRRAGEESPDAHAIASTCLRACGLDAPAVATARAAAEALLTPTSGAAGRLG
ncbi:TetR/AcrR family transcriptional regulator [Cellulomonas alba]|uniref:Helix-turn-helix domain-containing protein n=1 Tax=Cellulomonas alba TaxID=3053467 RepID=A0ABT7SFI5_9CELL|nr:TetR/AcrR family transcriptional regulator [Cellulomonas alba]MDM7854951.1 helix-turn-helix domain-containing protein [Cellulomonas alba]